MFKFCIDVPSGKEYTCANVTACSDLGFTSGNKTIHPFTKTVCSFYQVCYLLISFRVPWLSTVVLWATQSHSGASLGSASEVVSEETIGEIRESYEKMRNIYKMCFDNSPNRVRKHLNPLFDILII